MAVEGARRVNQEQLLQLASLYRGLSRKQLADALGRDPTKLFPPTGNPKLDYLMRLSDLLDWPVGDVAEAIWDGELHEGEETVYASFEQAHAAARDAHAAGDFRRMTAASQHMTKLATSPDQRALAAHREAGGWDGLGRYTRQLEAIRRGLGEPLLNGELREVLRVNLANAYYTLWHLLEARSLARDLIESLSPETPHSKNTRATLAFAHYVLGHASLRMIDEAPEGAAKCAAAAKLALTTSLQMYTRLADEFNHNPWRGIANTCKGSLLEVEVELAERPAADAVNQILEGLETVTDTSDGLVGDRLESYGWWCIAGCSITLRHLSGRDLHRYMAVFTNKGYEIADRLDNWAMRERLFTMEFLQRQRLNELAGFPVEWTIDNEEVRLIVGTMGRFPMFRTTGWKILQTATVVGDN